MPPFLRQPPPHTQHWTLLALWQPHSCRALPWRGVWCASSHRPRKWGRPKTSVLGPAESETSPGLSKGGGGFDVTTAWPAPASSVLPWLGSPLFSIVIHNTARTGARPGLCVIKARLPGAQGMKVWPGLTAPVFQWFKDTSNPEKLG